MSKSYMVRVGALNVGTETVHGTVVGVSKPNIDTVVLTFSDGSFRRFRYNQAVAVVEGA